MEGGHIVWKDPQKTEAADPVDTLEREDQFE